MKLVQITHSCLHVVSCCCSIPAVFYVHLRTLRGIREWSQKSFQCTSRRFISFVQILVKAGGYSTSHFMHLSLHMIGNGLSFSHQPQTVLLQKYLLTGKDRLPFFPNAF